MKLPILKTLSIAALVVFLCLPVIAPVQAVGLGEAEETLQTAAGEPYGVSSAEEVPPLAEVIGDIIAIALMVVGAIFLILMIYGGYTWMTAGGDSEKIKKAQQIIRNAVIGLVVVLGAYVITQFVVVEVLEATKPEG